MTFWHGVFIGLAIGWSLGGVVIWRYFVWQKLIRSREEWHEACHKGENAKVSTDKPKDTRQ